MDQDATERLVGNRQLRGLAVRHGEAGGAVRRDPLGIFTDLQEACRKVGTPGSAH